MANSVVSLAYFVSRAKRAGVGQDELKPQIDYRVFIGTRIDVDGAVDLWNAMYADDSLVPLNDIDIDETDFQDIADQVYRGIDPKNVQIAVARPPAVAPVHDSYFRQYLTSIQGDTRTGPAVTATLDRLEDVVRNRAVVTSRGNGLIVGRVQSGKTRNYIGLMLKAADEGWNVIIVLTSAIKALAMQTRNRIAEEFARVGADDPQCSRELGFLDNSNNKCAGAELNGDFFYWGVSMKEVHGLERIRAWFDKPNQPHRSMRVMIIDDESDSATPNASRDGQRLLSDEEIAERIEAIRRLPRYETLADWFDSLLQRDWPDLGAKTPEAARMNDLNTLLCSNRSGKRKQTAIINSADFRHFLGMDNFSNPPVEGLVEGFFHRQGRGGDDTYNAFVELLKSILDIARERSAINSAICSLIGPNETTGEYAYPFQRCAYLGYTATPYANILNEGPSHTPIYADFIQSLAIPPQYFGAEAIFGRDLNVAEPRMPVVNAIPESENAGILNRIRSGSLPSYSEPLSDLTFNGDDGSRAPVEWASLKDAVAWAFCTAAARRLRRIQTGGDSRGKIDDRWTTMLINVNHRQSIHESVREAISAFLKAQCSSPAAKAAFTERCRDVWQEQTAKFSHDCFDELFNGNPEADMDYGNIPDYPAWDDLSVHIGFFLGNIRRNVHVVVINCTADGQTMQRLYSQDADGIADGTVRELTDDHLWLVSGGNTIGRGLTLAGLTTSYFDRIRNGTCVDTLTQMGRWFGYRQGYELLPRLWMNPVAVAEMKRIATLEHDLHESIADNFAQGFSPSDPAHYQQISCWGRQLSGRAFAGRALDAVIGTMASADDYCTEAGKRQRVFGICERFISALGGQCVRDPAQFLYASTPLWVDVPRNDILALLDQLLPCTPERSRKILRGIIRDIAGADPVNWDVVIGNNERGQTVNFCGYDVGCGSPAFTPVEDGVIHTAQARLHMSFYAMIPAECIAREDTSLLEKHRLQIADAINARRVANDGILPRQYAEALPGGEDEDIGLRLDKLIEELRLADGAKQLPAAIHARLGDISQGLRNRSSAEYMASVHRAANHSRPVLQLYLVRPQNDAADLPPMVNISFYWPEHEPQEFFSVAVDENQGMAKMVTPRVFCQTVEDILRARDFPMQRKVLFCRVLERLGLRCNEAFFDSHIANPLEGYAYHKMNGRNAYCIDGWADDEEARLDAEFLQAALDILLRDRRPYTSGELIDKVVAEQPQFIDFYVPARDTGTLNRLMTDEILGQYDIEVTSRRPVTYSLRTAL